MDTRSYQHHGSIMAFRTIATNVNQHILNLPIWTEVVPIDNLSVHGYIGNCSLQIQYLLYIVLHTGAVVSYGGL